MTREFTDAHAKAVYVLFPPFSLPNHITDSLSVFYTLRTITATVKGNPQGKARKGSYEVVVEGGDALLFSKLDQFGPKKDRAALPDPVKNEQLWSSFLTKLISHVEKGNDPEKKEEVKEVKEVKEAEVAEEVEEVEEAEEEKKIENKAAKKKRTNVAAGTRRSKRLRK